MYCQAGTQCKQRSEKAQAWAPNYSPHDKARIDSSGMHSCDAPVTLNAVVRLCATYYHESTSDLFNCLCVFGSSVLVALRGV